MSTMSQNVYRGVVIVMLLIMVSLGVVLHGERHRLLMDNHIDSAQVRSLVIPTSVNAAVADEERLSSPCCGVSARDPPIKHLEPQPNQTASAAWLELILGPERSNDSPDSKP